MADISKVLVDEEYNIKDTTARKEKIDKYIDSDVPAVVNFLNGIKIKDIKISYDSVADTVTFE